MTPCDSLTHQRQTLVIRRRRNALAAVIRCRREDCIVSYRRHLLRRDWDLGVSFVSWSHSQLISKSISSRVAIRSISPARSIVHQTQQHELHMLVCSTR